MKAYMSDLATRTRWARVNRTHGVTAVREARAILADTEDRPGIYVFHAHDYFKVWRGDTIAPAIDRAAFESLADALAAFVAPETESDLRVYVADGILYCADCGREYDFCVRANECGRA